MSGPEWNLDFTEQVTFSLRTLYNRYGYSPYKMSKFEEYDLYARNKDFLISDSVITFTDLNGKLMALKPDVTLSIVKNSADRPTGLQKLYYNENVYRVGKGTRTFREIMQIGLEALGQVDRYCIMEVLMLAAKSLKCISKEAILDVSHLGLLSEFLASIGIRPEETSRVLQYLGEKNLHELSAACRSAGITEENIALLTQLAALSGPVHQVLTQAELLLKGRVNDNLLADYIRILSALADTEIGNALYMDFSVVDDIHYYNGIVFKGFIAGVPEGLLSGGEYNGLMRKMGKKENAIGFAVYLDTLERLNLTAKKFDVDCVLLYDESTSASDLAYAVNALVAEEKTVMAQRIVPENIKYRQLLKLNGKEVDVLENND